MTFMPTEAVKVLIFCVLVMFFVVGLPLWINSELKTPRDPETLEAMKSLKARREAYDAYIGYVIEINDAFAEQMKEELNLIYGANNSCLEEKIEEMGMSFWAERNATIAEARAILLLVIDKYLQAINAHKKIQPYLIESPFTLKHVNYSISFSDGYGVCPEGCVSSVHKTANFAPSGKVYYTKKDPFASEFHKAIVHLFEETYEEAERINEATPVQNPSVHVPTEQEAALVPAYRRFIQSMVEDYGLECWSIGEKNNNGVNEIGCYLVAQRHNEQEEARELIVLITKKLLQVINESENIKSPFSSDRLKITLEFVDDKHGAHYDGSMETVILEGNRIAYYHRIFYEHQQESFPEKKVLYLEETYPEAAKIVEHIPLKVEG